MYNLIPDNFHSPSMSFVKRFHCVCSAEGAGSILTSAHNTSWAGLYHHIIVPLWHSIQLTSVASKDQRGRSSQDGWWCECLSVCPETPGGWAWGVCSPQEWCSRRQSHDDWRGDRGNKATNGGMTHLVSLTSEPLFCRCTIWVGYTVLLPCYLGKFLHYTW